jgi:hypothetical protein
MRRAFVALLLLMEPLHFAVETLRVLPTIAYRGLAAAFELGVHAVVAVTCAAAASVFWNGGADARRLLVFAVIAAVGRTVQSVYWSVLPNDTPPGDEAFVVFVAVLVGVAVLTMGWRSAPKAP